LGPTVSQMFQHPAAHAAGRAVAATGFPWGLLVWLLVAAALAAGYFALRGRRTPTGPRLARRHGALAFGATNGRPRPWDTWPAAAAGAARAVRDRALGLDRSGSAAPGTWWRRLGLGSDGGLRVESRVQLAPGRWLVRVDTGEARLLLTVGADVRVIATEPQPAPGAAPAAPSPKEEADATGADGERLDTRPGAASEFARILGASLSRLGEERGEGRS